MWDETRLISVKITPERDFILWIALLACCPLSWRARSV